MSQITFSPQFSKRWLDAPQKVKDAIVQELDDIATLLNPSTDLDAFSFYHTDVDEVIETAYAQHHAEHSVSSHITALSNKTMMTGSEKAGNNSNKLPHNERMRGDPQHMTKTHFIEDSYTDTYSHDEDDFSSSDLKIIHELEDKIEDYLRAQMEIISQDLKDWLREEIKRR